MPHAIDDDNAATPMEVDEQQESGRPPAFSRNFNFNPNDYRPIEVSPAAATIAQTDAAQLMITHIEIVDFKSYAGTQVIGPFHKSFNSIVGPNGSGKSNVIDSMLFVFGYRANKIRSKKISVLIHNSETCRNIDSCTVRVHFQKIIDTGPEDSDYTIVPDSKFTVSRTAFKDNSSNYAIDGKKKTYREVAMLLRSQGIDLDHNRFLILQGEVEQIALMKPKGLTEHDEGMLEFLEDIVGSSRFKEPIERLANRVEELNEMRGIMLNRVKAVEKEKDDLEAAKNEAEEFLSVENNMAMLNNKIYQKYLFECTSNQEKATEELNKVKEILMVQMKKANKINEEMKEKVNNHNKIFKEYEALVKDSDSLMERFSEFEHLDVKCREDLKHTKAKENKLEKTKEQEKKKIEELKAMPGEAEKAIKRMNENLEKLEEQKKKEDEKLKVVMESLKTETKDLQAEKDTSEKQLLELQKAVNETRSQFEVAQSELEICLSNQQSESAKLKEVQKNLDAATSTLKDRLVRLEKLKDMIPEMEQTLIKTQEELKVATSAEEKSAVELRTVRMKAEEMKASMQASKSKGSVLKFLMEQKRSGKLPGILGRLGDLGAIDEKYDVAISTACGALDNIVVDTINTAQKCVEFLKAQQIGSATFIGLDKMGRWQQYVTKKIQTPENVLRLFDLVKVKDTAVLPAFYFALRDTLVADDLDQATRIAYGKTRYRVVTLQGQLISIAGTMTGGGTKVSRGRMGSCVIQEYNLKELDDTEAHLTKITEISKNNRVKKASLEEKINQLQQELKLLNHNSKKWTLEVKALEEQQESLSKQSEQQEERLKAAAPDEKQKKELQSKVSEYKKVYTEAANAASKVEAEVQRFHKQIMDFGGNKLKVVQSRVDAVSAQIDQVTGDITKAKVSVKTSERNLKKAQVKLKSIEEEKEESCQKMKKFENELKNYEVGAQEVLDSYRKAQNTMKELEVVLKNVKMELAKIEEQENTMKQENIEIKHQVEKYEDIVKTNNIKIKHWEKELQNLALHSIGGNEPEALPTFAPEDLENINKENIRYEITILEERLVHMKPNMAAINDYRKKEELYLKRVEEMDQISEVRETQKGFYEEMRKQRLDEFMAGFSIITNKLKEMYQMITLGGDAELELVDSLDPFTEGIVFSVRPPKKSWKNISNLSGGEKTLSSLSLVFALHHFKPTPLYIMDEIDAALDFKNVSIVANYIKERTRNAQFVIISLRNNMYELADRLVGIYKTNNCTKSVTINPFTLSSNSA